CSSIWSSSKPKVGNLSAIPSPVQLRVWVIMFRSILHLQNAAFVLVPGGFGDRGVKGFEFRKGGQHRGSRTHMGSTVRLGSRRTLFQTPDCITSKLYHNLEYVDERHRHRYEVGCNLVQVNPDVIGILEEAGLKFVGFLLVLCSLVILELPSHPFYVGVQFHPEFKSRPGKPSALFLGTSTNK
ncbi:unnamed protein product, partial [Prunus brigantina]